MAELDGRVALVTGGSRGIGRAICIELAAGGARVVVNYNANPALADEVVAVITAAGGEAISAGGDVANADAAAALVKATIDRFGSLDILVNNAGITRDGLLMRMTEDDWDAVHNTNHRGTFLVTKAAMRPMLRARGGRIINITSVVGVMGNAGQANYARPKPGSLGSHVPSPAKLHRAASPVTPSPPASSTPTSSPACPRRPQPRSWARSRLAASPSLPKLPRSSPSSLATARGISRASAFTWMAVW